MYFKLNGKQYDITACSVDLYRDPKDQTLRMSIHIDAKYDGDDIPEELSEVELYHESGFRLGQDTLEGLAGRRFVWESEKNADGEESGNLCAAEHEDITSGVIEILDISAETVKIRWTGESGVYGFDYDSDVSFDTEIAVPLPQMPAYKVLDGMQTSKLCMDGDTVLEIRNVKDYLKEIYRCEKRKKKDENVWKTFSVTLKLRLTHKEKTYDGEAVYSAQSACVTRFLTDCPCPVKITKTTSFPYFGQRRECIFRIEKA